MEKTSKMNLWKKIAKAWNLIRTCSWLGTIKGPSIIEWPGEEHSDHGLPMLEMVKLTFIYLPMIHRDTLLAKAKKPCHLKEE